MTQENNLMIFSNEEFGDIRTVTINNKPYLCAVDTAKALGYSNQRDAILRHCKGVVKHDALTTKGFQSVSFIPEGDVYRLIMKSKLPAAEKFEAWVMEEVLPQIRQTGGYIPIAKEDDEATIMAKALLIAQKTIDKKNEIIAAQQETIETQDKKLTRQQPLVNFALHVTDSSDTIDIGELAKVLHNEHINIGRNKLFQWLRENKIFMSTNIPYQKYIDKKYFKLIETTKKTAYGDKVFVKVLVTGRGQVYITEKLRREYNINLIDELD